MGKHKHSEVKGFLNIFHEAEIHAIPKASDEWIPIVPEKYGKKQIYQNGFLDILCEAEIHRNPNQGMSEFPHYGTSLGKHRQLSGCALSHRFRVSGKPCKPQCLVMCKFSHHRTILWKTISFPGWEFFRKS